MKKLENEDEENKEESIIIVVDESPSNSQRHHEEIVIHDEEDEFKEKQREDKQKYKQQFKFTPRNTPRASEVNISHESPQNHNKSLVKQRYSNAPFKHKQIERQELKDFDQRPHEKLIYQLEFEEKDQQQRTIIDQFITRFSKDQNQAIHYLIENGIIQDNPKSIAYALLTTEGLNKDAINKFFCSNKERNQQIFEAFCKQLNIKNVPYIQALRLLMQKFRLSGEAQQVDRMVKIFARVYHQENPQEFENEDTPYILAYSFIMLSTDAASVKIQQKDKMTKEQFVKNNIPIFKTIPATYYEQVYDQIVKEPFQTTVDYVEQIYNRMTLCNEPLQADYFKKALQIAIDLMKGCNLIKFGRYGKPKPRKLFLSEDEKRICWRSIDNDNEPARYINMHDVNDLALGCNTTEIMKKNKISLDLDMLCFSIITVNRSLDIQVNDVEMKSKWINYLKAVILNRRETEAKKAQSTLKRSENQAKREEIWKNDILPFWNSHWDYKKNKPENFKKYISVKKEEAIQKAQSKANARSILESICQCLKKTILLQPIQNQQNQSQILGNRNRDQQNSQEQGSSIFNSQPQIITHNRKNASLLLMILWKLGIPDFMRKTIWPLIIGNQLELTETLYKILQQQARKALCSDQIESYYSKSFMQINRDLEDLRDLFPFLQGDKEQQLINILRAFIFQRPDFGYISGMGTLASILVQHLSEYDSFQAFVNLIHQHHFIPIFIGDLRQIEWRIRFFEENLERILPLVYIQLKALNVATKLYLIRWFMTIYATQFELGFLSRLWDNFLLEGEIYLFKVALSYIKYFQLELKMSSLEEVQRILTTKQPNINEDYFFIQTDEIPIKEEDYVCFIQQQNIALINTKIHQSLLTQ